VACCQKAICQGGEDLPASRSMSTGALASTTASPARSAAGFTLQIHQDRASAATSAIAADGVDHIERRTRTSLEATLANAARTFLRLRHAATPCSSECIINRAKGGRHAAAPFEVAVARLIVHLMRESRAAVCAHRAPSGTLGKRVEKDRTGAQRAAVNRDQQIRNEQNAGRSARGRPRTIETTTSATSSSGCCA